MKTTIIAFSLVANLFLVGLVAFPKTAGTILQKSNTNPTSPAVAPPAGQASVARAAPEALPAKGAVGWSAFSTDARTFVDQARAAGMPDSLVRSLLQARIGEEMNAKRLQLIGPRPEIPYWKNQLLPLAQQSPEMQAELRRLSQSYMKLTNDLLGADPLATVSQYEKLQYGNLPADKVAQLKLIVQDYNELSSATRMGGVILPEDRAKLTFYESEKEKDIRAALTPAEYEEYQFRASTTANSMRRNLEFFEPSEAEFRAIFPLQEAFDKKYALIGGGMTLEQSRERQAAQQQLTADLKASLDPARLADYERATDFNYRSIVQVTTRMELPKDTANSVYSMQKDIQARATTIRQTPQTAQARIDQLTSLQAEANETLGTALGPKAFEMYKQSGGQWINTLVPAPPPAGGVRGAPPPGATIIRTL